MSHRIRRIISVFAFILASSAASAEFRVLVIHSYNADYSWVSEYSGALANELTNNDAVFDHYYLNTKKIPRFEFKQAADFAYSYFLKHKEQIDAVVLADDNAVGLLINRLTSHQVPIVFLGLNKNPRDFFENGLIPSHVSGVIERPLFIRQVIAIHELMPEVKSILVLLDDGVTSEFLAEQIASQYHNSYQDIMIDVRLIGRQDRWQTTVLESDHGAIIVGLYHTLRDNQGRAVEPDRILSWTSTNSSVPLFGVWSFSVGPEKTIGGLVLTGEEQGEMAAKIIRSRVLNIGTPIPRISVAEQGVKMYSQHMLDRFNLKIPANIIESVELRP